ncbi:CMRF35-like molecule 8 [Dissostichus eleginoides]|uniref:CMRF35-like molecule 8 n=1 Tax=Dissostichus eleginoides TaxID=100907 RepID=A0AAD9CHP5_DISEL|nr:CMRF35-like molecule 8 [Dissostichus eleginoides]
MKRFLLLFLSLMTGCEARSEVKGCRGGWVDFTCGYPKKNEEYARIDLVRKNNRIIIQTTQKDVWESEGRFSMYQDKERKNIRVVIKEIQQEQTYKLHFRPEHKPNKKDKEEVELELYNRCQKPFNPIADRTHTIIIKCGKENEDDSRCNLFCKENGPICEDILSTKNNLRSNGTFTLTETESGFTVSISNVSTQHTGVYWCGVEIKDRKIWYRAALRKIEVKGVSWIPRVAAVVCVALLGLLLFLVFCYKHSCCSKNKRKGEAHNVEDHANDEIQERPLVTGPGTALQSLYVTANAPTNPSASPYYSTINAPTDPSASLDYSTITAHNISAEAGGETYSTVRDQAQSAAYSTVNHPSRLPEDPFYSSVNHPQPQQT